MRLKSAVRSEKACAKINLTLEVIGQRDDGYHEIASVVQAIDLCDTVYFQPGEHVRLSCNIPELVSPDNLVAKAVRLLQDVADSIPGVSISVEKTIPMAGGLGGGSSDAAVTLRALNEIWALNLDAERLRSIATKLGSDVPFFLCHGATALVQGRGERVTPLPSLAKTWVVVVRPPINMANKTQEMYSRLDPSRFTGGKYTQRMVGLIERRERIDPRFCYNVFDDIAFSSLAGLEDYRLRFLAAGAGQVHLAGSGPALFSLVADKAQGEKICRQLEKEKLEIYLVHTL